MKIKWILTGLNIQTDSLTSTKFLISFIPRSFSRLKTGVSCRLEETSISLVSQWLHDFGQNKKNHHQSQSSKLVNGLDLEKDIFKRSMNLLRYQ